LEGINMEREQPENEPVEDTGQEDEFLVPDETEPLEKGKNNDDAETR
jgi:hypothetical protein